MRVTEILCPYAPDFPDFHREVDFRALSNGHRTGAQNGAESALR
jgi:hypothetical protein